MAITTPLRLDAVADLPSATATDVKKTGWRGVMRTLVREGRGKLVITNNKEPQAVILSPDEYEEMVGALRTVSAKKEADLEELRRDFDRRLAGLKAPGAAERLRRVLSEPISLGDVRAGEGY